MPFDVRTGGFRSIIGAKRVMLEEGNSRPGTGGHFYAYLIRCKFTLYFFFLLANVLGYSRLAGNTPDR